MKRITYILVLVIIYLISGARSCTNDADFQQMKEEKSVLASVDSIKKAFVVGSPDDQHLRALETTAKQKLIDFADYLKIASESSLDKTFRHQAIEMAGKLFISGKAETRNWSKAYPGLNLPELEALPGKNLSGGIPCSESRCCAVSPLGAVTLSAHRSAGRRGQPSGCQTSIPCANTIERKFRERSLITATTGAR